MIWMRRRPSGFVTWLYYHNTQETWCIKWHKIKVVIASHLEIVGSDRQGGWGAEWRDDRMEEGGGRGWSNVPTEGAPAGGQILFMETSWPARSEPRQTYSTHDPPFYLSFFLSLFPPAFKLLPIFFLLPRLLTSISFPSLYLFYPTAFSPLFLSQKYPTH